MAPWLDYTSGYYKPQAADRKLRVSIGLRFKPRAGAAWAHETLAMPKVVFPVLPDGLLVDVVIGLDGDTIAAQIAAGGDPPTSVMPLLTS